MPDKQSTESRDLTSLSDQVVDLNERAWLPRYCRGEKSCFLELMNAYKKPVYGYLIRSGFNRSSCEDLFQEIFAKVHHAAHRYDPSQALKPWIFTIAVNTVRNHLRKTPKYVVSDTDIDCLTDPGPAPEQLVNTGQTLSRLEHLIAGLSDAQRQVLILSSVEELSQKEIAEALDLPLNTVKTHLRRARQTLLNHYSTTTDQP